MRRRGVAVLAVGVVLLGGCSAAEPSPVEDGPGETSAAPVEDDSTTTEQWASEIAKLRSSYDDAQASWDDATCSAMAVPDAPDCNAWMVTMGYVADTAQITLDGLQNEDGPTYLGTPPEEIASLLADTTESATNASAAGQEVSCPGDGCLSTAFEFEQAWDALGEQFAGWDPYL
jgi:hypothetical protein